MGVKHLWRTLEKGGAVELLDGGDAAQHCEILDELEGAAVAVDLSAWLVQAQTQPALAQNYDSDFACALKVVFDRTIHWLRHGCLPLFVIEGNTPEAKLEKLRQRCIATYGPGAGQRRVGNNAGSRFSSLGRKVAELLDCLGVPWVQAEGEGEATCAALNMCGWAQGCYTADVDALLFGAVTVYRTLSLSTANPRQTQMARCRRAAVQRVLRLQQGGTQALIAVAQLAGGDYDVAGADRVGDVLAVAAVRCLLKDRQSDADVLELLQQALARGADPHLDSLTKCTGGRMTARGGTPASGVAQGCKCCGHEGGRKNAIKKHGKEGCAECGTAGPDGGGGCIPIEARPASGGGGGGGGGRQQAACGCEFHCTSDERLLNRVVRRAVATNGFLESCRVAARTYASEARQAVAAVQRAYGLARPGGANVFTWRRRPDVRLKLLPLLLEWDIRCGPVPPPGSGAQLRPVAIKKVSGARLGKAAPPPGADDDGEPPLPEEGWRYVIEVERMARPLAAAGYGLGGGSGGGQQQQGKQGDGGGAEEEAEDLAIDTAWLTNTARSRPAKAGADGAAADDAGDDDGGEGEGGASQGGSSQGGKGRKPQGTLPFGEHRSVRCTLVHELWPHLVLEFHARAGKKAGAKGNGKGGAGAGSGGAKGRDEKQPTLKEFFQIRKAVQKGAAPGGEGGGAGKAGVSGG
ncbi:putative Flap endonuclease GEN [Monoraphidium neglectum]|uniref:Putative Flap endonuclease GEN n=1 Tax=Monoraphidium neglectum TaxID=145388 RepID=A0A0D2LF40_9CHLO|nr:putative Flap endonuclease GEN [Monoraphidium neglectum]KIZ05294.1 putative Flap endonuclease GEN [Monoraphidium neglectum]|eukprot:XP_013904313.1 putative Flap endonuclease GEN [Monoraphidium neglectum]